MSEGTTTLLPPPQNVTQILPAPVGVTQILLAPQEIAQTLTPAAGITTVVEPAVTHLTTLTVGQGPRGPVGPQGPGAAPNYLGRTLNYTSEILTEVLLYLDAEKTDLGERRVLQYTGEELTSIQYFNGVGTLLFTRLLIYTNGVLTGVTDS